MKISLCLLLILLISVTTSAQTPVCLRSAAQTSSGDQWLAHDKFLHFTVSAGLAFGSYYIYREEFRNTEEGSGYFGGSFSLSVGALKEYYDYKHPDHHAASWKDFTADAAGTGLGILLAYWIIN